LKQSELFRPDVLPVPLDAPPALPGEDEFQP
jgi:hypothetical protein